jgi:hypothetical protein
MPTKDYAFQSYDDLCAQPGTDVTDHWLGEETAFDAERRERRQWGYWRLELDTLELAFNKPGRMGGFYIVDLDRITNPAQALDWIAQLAGKGWLDATDIGNLVFALNDIFDLQGTLCGSGRARTILPADLIRRRYRAA